MDRFAKKGGLMSHTKEDEQKSHFQLGLFGHFFHQCVEACTTALEKQLMRGGIRLNLYGMMFSLNFQLNTKRYVPKAFLSPFVDGMAMAQTLARCVT